MSKWHRPAVEWILNEITPGHAAGEIGTPAEGTMSKRRVCMQSPEQSERDGYETMKDGNPIDGTSYVANTDADDDLDGLEEDDSDDSDLNLLIAMAELDAEAAEAYRIAAEYTDQVHLRTKLEEFRADHLRHVEMFNRLLTEAGVLEV